MSKKGGKSGKQGNSNGRYIPRSEAPTQEANLFSLLGARVREQVEEMDAYTAMQALLHTYDENTLALTLQDPIQLRYMLQNALPGFLEVDRKVFFKPTF